jgi:hypothetical protein
MVLTPVRLQATTRQFLADSPLVLVSGVLAMAAGLAIINTHNIWVLSWPLIVTLFGWAMAIGGAARVVAPAAVNDVGTAMMDRPVLTRVMGVAWGTLGAFLIFKGYS